MIDDPTIQRFAFDRWWSVIGRLFSSSNSSPICGLPYNPYDRSAREEVGEQLFREFGESEPLGTIERSRLLLKIMEDGFPTEAISTSYFHNLNELLRNKNKRAVPGQIVIGLGTGRCGSTSLASLLSTVGDSCATHENPPQIFWVPFPEQVRFHVDRLRVLREYFALIADVSHWWLNVTGDLVSAFPGIKMIGLYRNEQDCVRSFMRIKRYGSHSWNHWVTPGHGIWATHSWDPCYPTYSMPAARSNLDAIKGGMISRYVSEYNMRLHQLAKQFSKNIHLVKTEALNLSDTQARVFEFVGIAGRISKHTLNYRSVNDGTDEKCRF
jgi:hypothetical protein